MNMYLYFKWVVYYISIYYSVLESLAYSPAIQRACQYRWNLVGDKCYFFSDEFKNYALAKEFCDELKPRGRLYVPLNESELTLVAQEASEHMDGQFILLGVDEAERVQNTKTWYWRSGQKITSPWCQDQPIHHANQKVLIVTRNSPHCLHDDTTSNENPFICQEESDVQTFCPDGFILHYGRCFGAQEDERYTFMEAEEKCSELPGGHLAAFRNDEELTLINGLYSDPEFWIGLRKVSDDSEWEFTDGTTRPPDEEPLGATLSNCANNRKQTPDCSTKLHYACMTEAQGLIIPKHEPTSLNHSELFDFNVTTCINCTAALHQMGFYIMDLIIPHKLNNGTVTVWFNQPVDCNRRQVINTWKQAAVCRNGGYLKSCDLLTTGTTPSTSYEYRCPCAEDGCEIVLVDDTKQQEQEAGDICEITYEN